MYTKDHRKIVENKTDSVSDFDVCSHTQRLLFKYFTLNKTNLCESSDSILIQGSCQISSHVSKLFSNLSSEILEGSNVHPIDIDINYFWPTELNKKPLLPRTHYSKVQQWVGHITSVKSESFIAELEDVTVPGTLEIVEFENSEVSPAEIKYIKVGAGFYWSVGHANISGQRSKQSILIFQKGVNFNSSEVDMIEERVQDLYQSFNWDIK